MKRGWKRSFHAYGRPTPSSKVHFAMLCPGETKIELDEKVWSKEGLHEEFFFTMLAFLPLSSSVRMRAVCKKWNIVARDNSYRQACERAPRQEPSLFLTKEKGPILVYEPALDAWKKLPPFYFSLKVSDRVCSPVAAAGGWLLFWKSAHSSLSLYNPLNETERILPTIMDGGLITVTGMYVDDGQDCYNILVGNRKFVKSMNVRRFNDEFSDEDSDVELDLEAITYQIYDSRTCAWKSGKFNPLSELRILGATVCGNFLHYLTDSVEGGLATYTIGISAPNQRWQRSPVPIQDLTLAAPHIFSTRRKIMLAAAVPQQVPRGLLCPEWKSIIIWELLMGDELEWVMHTELDLPEEVENFRSNKESFIFMSEGDSLYFGVKTGSFLGVINMNTQKWKLLPAFPGYDPHRGTEVFEIFVYEPRFGLVDERKVG